MSAVRGWCPGAWRPMRSGDGLILRIRPRGGRLDPDQMRAIAAGAERWGNGTIELTGRANIQLRGVADTGHAPLMAALTRAGLIDPDPAAESLRNIIVTPFADVATDALAEAVARALVASGLPLPAKFGVAIDGAAPVLRNAPADIRIEGGLIRADGMDRAAPLRGPDDVVALARWFLDRGGAPEGRGRMAALIARGIRPDAPLPAPAPGPTPEPGALPDAAGWLAGCAFGQIAPDTLRALALRGPVRLTPWRMIRVPGAAPPAGLIVAPGDPLMRIHACPGAPACAAGHAPVRDIARALARHLPPGATMHLSGCAKGCACPRPADIVLTATPDGFALVRDGRAGDAPLARGTDPAALITCPPPDRRSPDAPQL